MAPAVCRGVTPAARYAKRHTPTAVPQSASEIFVEKIEGTSPGQLGGGLIVTRRCVIMKTMIGPFINVGGVSHMICLKRFLVGWPSSGDTRIQGCVVKQKGRLDLGSICGRRLPAIEWN